MKKDVAFKVNGIDLGKGNLSKEEEIQVLHFLRIGLQHTGNYLESLFSKEACDDWEREIRNDICPDPYGAHQITAKQLMEAERKIRLQEDEIKVLKGHIEDLKAKNLRQKESFNEAQSAREDVMALVRERNGNLSRENFRLKALEANIKAIFDHFQKPEPDHQP